MSGINGVVAHLALGFALKQLAQFGEETDFKKVEEEFAVWLEVEVPYVWADKAIEAVADPLIETIGVACQRTSDLAMILTSLKAGDYAGAGAALVALVKKVASPEIGALLPAAA